MNIHIEYIYIYTYGYILSCVLFPMDHHFLLFGCLYLLAVQFFSFLCTGYVYLSTMSPEVSSHFGTRIVPGFARHRRDILV